MRKMLKRTFVLLIILCSFVLCAQAGENDAMIKSLMRTTGIIDDTAKDFNWDANVTYDDIDSVIGRISGGKAAKADCMITTLAKSFVSLTGYEEQIELLGGGDDRYLSYAARLDITLNLDMTDDNVTYIEMARMIYNTFQVEVVERASYGSDSISFTSTGDTVLEHYFDISEHEGIITATERSSIYSKAHADEDTVEIDNLVYECAFPVDGELLGRRVTVFYKENAASKREVLYMTPADEDDLTTIYLTDIAKFTKNEVTYETSKKKDENIDIPATAIVLTNGVFTGYVSSTSESDIYSPEYRGIMYLIDNDGNNKVDIVSVIRYDVSVVQSVYPDSFMVICTDKNYRLTDEYNPHGFDYKLLMDGEEISFDKLSPWDVLIVDYAENTSGKRFYTINVIRRSVQGTLTEISDDKVVINNIEYGMHPSLDSSKIKLGMTGEFLIGGNDEIVDIKSDTMYKYGYFIKYGSEGGLASANKIQIVDAGGEPVILTLADNVYITGAKSNSVSSKDAGSYLTTHQLIGYEVNASGLVTDIHLASDEVDHDNHDHENKFSLCMGRAERKYVTGSGISNSLAWEIFPSNTTLVFFVDESDGEIDEDDIDVGSFTGYVLDEKVQCAAYDSNRVNEPKVIVVYSAAKTEVQEDRTTYEVIVDKVVYALDDEGEARPQLVYYDHTGVMQRTFFANEVTKSLKTVNPHTGVEIPAKYMTGTHLDLKAGDIIKFVKDSDGYISIYLPIFKASAEHTIGDFSVNNDNALPVRDQVYSNVKYVSGNKFVLPCNVKGVWTDRVFETNANTVVYKYDHDKGTIKKAAFADLEPQSSAVYTANGSEVFVVRLYGVIRIMIIMN